MKSFSLQELAVPEREPLDFFVDPKFPVAHRKVWFPVDMLCRQCDATKVEGNIVFRGDT